MAEQGSITHRAGRSRRLRFAAALLLGSTAGAFLATPASAQQVAASLRGVITDSGQPAGTSVAAVNVDTGFRRVSPIASGAYNFGSLPAGRYRLEVTTASGTRQTDVFTLTVAQNAQLSFDLSPAAASAGAAAGETPPPNPNAPAETASNETAGGGGGDIIVTGNRIKTLDAGSVGKTIDQHTIESLPQNSRNFLAFADLAPGVQFVTGANGQTSLRGGAQSGNAINVFIDGVSQKDDVLKSGITGQDSSQGNPFPQLAIAQYKVISQNYKAEFDQVGSAAITAVTKSGTNQFHGEAFGDFSNQSLRAATPQEKADGNGKIKSQDIQFGGALGGPIIKDVMHFFVSYEGKRQKNPIDIFGPEADQANVPEPYADSFGAFSQRFNEDLYFGKIDISPTDNDLIEASIKVRREDGLTPGDGQFAISARSDIKNNEYRGLLHYQHTGDGWINDANLSYEKSFFNPTPNDVGQGYQQEFHNSVNGTVLIYGAGIDYQKKGQKGLTFQDDFTYTALEHNTFKVGFKAKWVTLNAFQQSPYNPHLFYDVDYSNPLDSDGFNDTLPYRLQFGVPVEGSSGGGVRSHDFQFGLYAQDDWDITDRLTFNFGLRWDFEHNLAYLKYVTPEGVVDALKGWANIQNTDYDYHDFISTGHNRHSNLGEFQPRLGFTYDVSSDGRFQVFGGYGRSYNRDQFDFLALEQLQGSYKTIQYNFDTGDTNNTDFDCDPAASANCIAWDPAYLTQAGRDTLTSSANDGGREVDLIDNNLKVPYSDQFSLGARGRFGALHAEVGYTHVASRDGFAFFLGNRQADGSFYVPGTPPTDPTQQLPSEGSPFGNPVPGYGNLILGTNGVETNLDSVYLKLDKDYSKSSPWSLDVTYTFSLAEENLQDAAFTNNDYAFDFPTLQDHPFKRSTGVPKHRLIATGSADLPFGFMFSGKLTLQSPSYIYGTALADVDDPYNFPGIPVVVEGKNKHAFVVGDLWAVRQVDLALTKYIGLGFLHEGTQIRLRADVFNVFNTRNYTSYEGNARGVPGNNINNLPASFGTVNGLSTGGYPPRTFKFTLGVSF